MLSEYDKVYFFNVTLLLVDIKEIHILKNIFGGINSQLLMLASGIQPEANINSIQDKE